MANPIVVTFTCRSCGNEFQHKSRDLTLQLPEIQCPVCLWSPIETVER